ncbi:MAG TPA: hypothetical protein VNT76_21140 [Candidatus Binatus sp.]|nr:hypothetical protein [Candidatus Binatus sp.]
MNSSAAHDYGLHESNGNGNGDGKKPKPFGLHAIPDPDTLAILKSRDDAIHDKDLSASEKNFVVFAIDRATQYKFYQEFKKGITCIADSVVAEALGVTERSIYNWRHNPDVGRYLWFSKTRRPDKWAMMLYHLVCLHPVPATRHEWKDRNGGGSYAGGSKARQAEPDAADAARGREIRNAKLAAKRAQKTLPLTGGIAVVTGNFTPVQGLENTNLQAFSADCRNNFRPTAETPFGSQPKPVSADSRNAVRLTAESPFGSEPKEISAASRKTVLPTAETECHYKEPKSERVEIPIPKRVDTRAKAARNDTPKRRGKIPVTDGEIFFMALCLEVFGKAEMDGPLPGKLKGNGGLWRELYRENPRKALACVQETKLVRSTNPATLKKGSNWARYCMDLWKADRLNYDEAEKIPPSPPVTKRAAAKPISERPAWLKSDDEYKDWIAQGCPPENAWCASVK